MTPPERRSSELLLPLVGGAVGWFGCSAATADAPRSANVAAISHILCMVAPPCAASPRQTPRCALCLHFNRVPRGSFVARRKAPARHRRVSSTHHSRIGHRQACLPAARGRCSWQGSIAAEVLAFFKALPPCLVGIEACGTAHYWAREIRELGHEVRLMPPSYVAPYVKRGKTDATDAAAICEAVTRPTMRFVPIKTADQQAVLMLHRTRDLLVR